MSRLHLFFSIINDYARPALHSSTPAPENSFRLDLASPGHFLFVIFFIQNKISNSRVLFLFETLDTSLMCSVLSPLQGMPLLTVSIVLLTAVSKSWTRYTEGKGCFFWLPVDRMQSLTMGKHDGGACGCHGYGGLRLLSHLVEDHKMVMLLPILLSWFSLFS